MGDDVRDCDWCPDRYIASTASTILQCLPILFWCLPPPSLDPLQSSRFVTFVTSQRKRGLVLGGAMDPRANSATLLFGLITLITVCSPSSLICGFTRERTAVGHAAAVVGMPREGLQLRLRGGRRSLNLSEAIPVTEEDDLAQVRPVRVCASCKAPASAEADLRRCVWCKQAWYARLPHNDCRHPKCLMACTA